MIDPVEAERAPVGPRSVHPRRRRAVAVAVGVAAAVAAGAAGGYVAGDRRADRLADEVAASRTVFDNASIDPGGVVELPTVASSAAKADVADLVAAAMPSIVSITVQVNGERGAGTGFVVTSDGQIATNAHVVADADRISVQFNDGTTADATVVGVSRSDDLAVITVDRTGLRALPLGESASLRVGEPVVAIGNALDLTGSPTATLGIISSLDRSIETDGGYLAHVLQTDAAINPGNSGGPLLTLDGRVIGINSAGSKDAQNVGFAIAIDVAKPILTQLQEGEVVTRPFLGVATDTVDPVTADRLGLSTDRGALITEVTPDSAAADAGLRRGDVIVSANGTPVDDEPGLRDAIRATGAGNPLELEVERNGKTVTLTATLTARES